MIVDRREMRQRLAGLIAKMTNYQSPLVVSMDDKPSYEVPVADKSKTHRVLPKEFILWQPIYDMLASPM